MTEISHMLILDGTAAIVKPAGPINSGSAPDLDAYISTLSDDGAVSILLDAEGIEFFSSAGIGLLLYLERRITQAGGCFILFSLNPEITSLFSALGFDGILKTASSRVEAIEAADTHSEISVTFQPTDTVEPEPDTAETKTEEPAVSEYIPPFIVECPRCGALIKIREDGDFMCPDCGLSISVAEDRTVTFGEISEDHNSH